MLDDVVFRGVYVLAESHPDSTGTHLCLFRHESDPTSLLEVEFVPDPSAIKCLYYWVRSDSQGQPEAMRLSIEHHDGQVFERVLPIRRSPEPYQG